MTTSTLYILKLQRPEDAVAPEFQYLLSFIETEAQRLYERVYVLAGTDPLDFDVPQDRCQVLILGEANVLLARRSLRRMRDLLGESNGVVVPHRLSASGLVSERPVYTLSDYEGLESRFLAASPIQAPASASHLPISLFSHHSLRSLVDAHSLERVLTDPGLLSRHSPPIRPFRSGLFHEFIDYYGETRSDILDFIPEGAVEILEIGCGRGTTAELLRKTFGCRVTGVELNPVVAAQAARRLDRVVQGDVLEANIGGRYDVILALELVEHLPEPERFLKRARQLLRPGGRIILSLPNVGHYSVVLDLLAGRWDYLPIGLLCYTHLRFFTRKTVEDWLRRCGLQSFEIIPQTTELPRQLEGLPSQLRLDRESLSTKGFYVLVDG